MYNGKCSISELKKVLRDDYNIEVSEKKIKVVVEALAPSNLVDVQGNKVKVNKNKKPSKSELFTIDEVITLIDVIPKAVEKLINKCN